MKSSLTYKDAGVDITGKDKFLDKVTRMMRRTYDPRVIELPRGFSGLFSLAYKDQLFGRRYKSPVLVSCTDGVGTKLKIAFMMDKHDTVGIDLVAMSVNDLIVQGAEPLFFLDYIAAGKLAEPILLDIIKGVVAGCQTVGCALLGGETAEMPGFYPPGEYELAGFATGIVEKRRIITGQNIRPGDFIVGLASNGLHSNGYSLVRKVFFDKAKMKVSNHLDELGITLGEELLRPTRIYARAIKELLTHYRRKNAIKGMANITGGGMLGNITRILPPGTAAEIVKGKWTIPPIFDIIQKLGNVVENEMYRVFNMGIGMVIIVDPYFVSATVRRLENIGEQAYVIGQIKKGERGVRIK